MAPQTEQMQFRMSPDGPLMQFDVSQAGKVAGVLPSGIMGLIALAVLAVTYTPTGTDDQTALNALVAANPNVPILVHAGAFDCDVDSSYPSNTSLTYAPGVNITGAGDPFALKGATATAIGTVHANAARGTNTIAIESTTAIVKGDKLAFVDDPVLLPNYVESVTGTGTALDPFICELQSPLSCTVTATANVYLVTNSQTNINIDCGGCSANVAGRNVEWRFAENCHLKNLKSSTTPGNDLLQSCSQCTIADVHNLCGMKLFGSYHCHATGCTASGISDGPACAVDDCFLCTVTKTSGNQSTNGLLMATNYTIANGSDGNAGSYACQFIDCDAVGNSDYGIAIVNGCYGCGVIGCVTTSNTLGGVFISGTAGSTFGSSYTLVDHVISANNGRDILVLDPDQPSVFGTVIRKVTCNDAVNKCFIAAEVTFEDSTFANEAQIEFQAGSYNVRIERCDMANNYAGFNLSFDAGMTGRVDIIRSTFKATGAAQLVVNSAAELHFIGNKFTCAGGTAVNSNGTVYWGPDNDVSGVANAIIGTGKVNFGDIALQGATPVTYAFPKTSAGSRVSVVRKTVAGTPANFSWAISAGVGVVITGVALDTSTVTVSIDA